MKKTRKGTPSPAQAAAPALPPSPEGALRERVSRWLEKRFLLRLHMFWILTGTFLAGIVATRLLYALHVNHLGWRYALAVLAAYGVFFVLIRFWLWYIGVGRTSSSSDSGGGSDWLDGIDFSSDGIAIPDFGGGGGADVSQFAGGGGRFGGGGSTGSWGSGSSKSSGGGGFDIGGDDDFVIIILIVVLIVVLVCAAFYVIWIAPAMLSEAAFNAILSAALARKTKKIVRDESWEGSIFRATRWPLLAVLVVAVALGVYAHKHCPSARRLSDAIHCAVEPLPE